MARYSKPASYFKGRKCCECDKDISIGKDHGYRRHDEKNNWTGEWLCTGCYIRNYQRNEPESQNNIKKLMRDWRMGNLDPSSPPGKGFIGAQIVAKTLGIDDCNIEMDNFRFFIDLSKHSEYGYVEVKTRSLVIRDQSWNFEKFKGRKFDTLIVICMDEEWKNVEKVYAIPYEESTNMTRITIHRDFSKLRQISKYEYLEKYRIDEMPFNEIFNKMDMSKCKVLRKKR